MAIKDRPRLGRGLKALIPTPVEVSAAGAASGGENPQNMPPAGLRQIEISKIDPNPHQPRESIDPLSLAELVASIKATGVLQPVLLRTAGERFELIAGHRRTRAAWAAGLTTIPAIIRDDATEEMQTEWALIENIQRQDLNPIERARAYRDYVDRFHLTHEQASQRMGEERVTISNFLRLLELNKGVQDLVARGILSAGHAKVLAGVTDPARQDSLANRAATEGMSVRRLEELADLALAGETVETEVAGHLRTLAAKSPHILELEQDLSRKLGTKLRIFPAKKKNTGKIVIQYFSLDEFDRIVERFEKQ